MDFLDPEKIKHHKIILFTGYFFISVLVGLVSLMMYYLVYDGYSINGGGKLIRNGLVFISSQPHPANLYLNGVLNSAQTNKHIFIPEGIYNVSLQRDGYRTWNRSIEVDGGQIAHFDYPLLIPVNLNSTKVNSYTANPTLFSESNDSKTLLIGSGSNLDQFDQYDLSNKQTPLVKQVTVPSSVLNKKTSTSYSVIAWANDNSHVLLKRNYVGGSDFIVLNISDAATSFNLSSYLSNTKFTDISFNGGNYNQFYVYDSSSLNLYTLSYDSANTNQTVQYLSGVLAYKDYTGAGVVYVTKDKSSSALVDVNIRFSGVDYLVKKLPAGSNYLLSDGYSDGVPYVALGVNNLNKVYVYKDPIAQDKSNPFNDPTPSQVLSIKNPNYLSFSKNNQYVMAENGNQFGVYDIYNDHGYNYTTNYAIDDSQGHAEWMDNNRISYVSGGKVVIFDYDNNYAQLLNKADSDFQTAFDNTDTYFYKIVKDGDVYDFYKTSFYTPNDQP